MSWDSDLAWRERRKIWNEFVSEFSKLLDFGSHIQTGPSNPRLLPSDESSEHKSETKVLMFSPHPDDEALVGGFPLRLRLELGASITNCAVTLGSNKAERERRREEVEASCGVLGFNLLLPSDRDGLDEVTPDARHDSPNVWSRKVESIAEILRGECPDMLFFPHAKDFNSTHLGTHLLIMDALKNWPEIAARRFVVLVETEYWHQLSEPNLLVGLGNDTVARLVMAVAEHGGEVARNSYHVRLPARLIDNVRRGAEVVGEQGASSPNFTFAELYRVSVLLTTGALERPSRGLVIGPEQDIQLTELAKYFSPR